MIRLRNIKFILAGLLILPMGLATVACSPIYADDPIQAPKDSLPAEINFDGLKATIQTAIQNEEITQGQVEKRIGLLKKEFSEHDRNSAKFESIKVEIAAALESGEITQEEADTKLASLEERKEKGKKWNGKRHHHKKPMIDIEDVKAKISIAVESGELTQEEGDAKLAAIQAKMDSRQEKMAAKLESIKGGIAAAVQSGEITQAEGDAKLAGLEEKKGKSRTCHGKGHHHKKPTMDVEDLKAKISAAMESGEITQEEADAKLADIQAKMDSRQEKMAAKLESIEGEIASALQSGEITQEDADAKLASLEERKEKGKKWHGKRHHHKKPMSGEITQEDVSDKLRYLERQPKKVIY